MTKSELKETADNEEIKRISSLGLFRWGYSYLIAGNLLSRSNDDMILYPRLFMYAHAIELGLKAYIYEKVGSLSKNHQLESHLKEAADCGLNYTDSFGSIVRTFNALNMDEHRIRYFKFGPMSFPNGQVLFSETNDFYTLLQSNIPDADRIVRRHKDAAN